MDTRGTHIPPVLEQSEHVTCIVRIQLYACKSIFAAADVRRRFFRFVRVLSIIFFSRDLYTATIRFFSLSSVGVHFMRVPNESNILLFFFIFTNASRFVTSVRIPGAAAARPTNSWHGKYGRLIYENNAVYTKCVCVCVTNVKEIEPRRVCLDIYWHWRRRRR